eukprot:g27038.t1
MRPAGPATPCLPAPDNTPQSRAPHPLFFLGFHSTNGRNRRTLAFCIIAGRMPCSICQQAGHNKRTCPVGSGGGSGAGPRFAGSARETGYSSPRRTVHCSHCNQPDHNIRTCPQKAAEERRTEEQQRAKEKRRVEQERRVEEEEQRRAEERRAEEQRRTEHERREQAVARKAEVDNGLHAPPRTVHCSYCHQTDHNVRTCLRKHLADQQHRSGERSAEEKRKAEQERRVQEQRREEERWAEERRRAENERRAKADRAIAEELQAAEERRAEERADKVVAQALQAEEEAASSKAQQTEKAEKAGKHQGCSHCRQQGHKARACPNKGQKGKEEEKAGGGTELSLQKELQTPPKALKPHTGKLKPSATEDNAEGEKEERPKRGKDKAGLIFTKSGKLDMRYHENKEAMASHPHPFVENGQGELKRKAEGMDLLSFKQAHRSLNPHLSDEELDSLYYNLTGTDEFRSTHLKQSSKKCREKVNIKSTLRDADHIFETQHFVDALQKKDGRLTQEEFHELRTILNGEENLISRGKKVNRDMGQINRDLTQGVVKLNLDYLEMLQFQAKQARLLSQQASSSKVQNLFANKAEEFDMLHRITQRLMDDRSWTRARVEQHFHDMEVFEQKYKKQISFEGNALHPLPEQLK